MLISKCRNLLQTAPLLGKRLLARNSSDGTPQYLYRDTVEIQKCVTWQSSLEAEFISALGWWWMVWHFITDFEHVIPEDSAPYPETWTDEELGIPPDDI